MILLITWLKTIKMLMSPKKSNNKKQNDISDPDHPNVQEINNVETTLNADSEVDIDSDKKKRNVIIVPK